jgi:hypothetical protein
MLLSYQHRWLNDKSRYKIALKARQIGFTTVICFEAIEMALENKCRILILSTTERQSREVMERIYDILNVAKRVKNLKLPRETRTEIMMPNGSRIISLPASPASVRGYTAMSFSMNSPSTVMQRRYGAPCSQSPHGDLPSVWYPRRREIGQILRNMGKCRKYGLFKTLRHHLRCHKKTALR